MSLKTRPIMTDTIALSAPQIQALPIALLRANGCIASTHVFGHRAIFISVRIGLTFALHQIGVATAN